MRRAIDTLDREVVALIGRRARYVEAAARFKTGESGVRAPERRKRMLEERRLWAEEEGLSPDLVESVYETMIGHFVGREMDIWRSSGRAGADDTA